MKKFADIHRDLLGLAFTWTGYQAAAGTLLDWMPAMIQNDELAWLANSESLLLWGLCGLDVKAESFISKQTWGGNLIVRWGWGSVGKILRLQFSRQFISERYFIDQWNFVLHGLRLSVRIKLRPLKMLDEKHSESRSCTCGNVNPLWIVTNSVVVWLNQIGFQESEARNKQTFV